MSGEGPRHEASERRLNADRGLHARIDLGGPMAAAHAQARAPLGGNTPSAADAPELEELQPIVVEASAPGLPPVRVSIAVSTDAAADGIAAVAEAGAGKQVDFFATSAPE